MKNNEELRMFGEISLVIILVLAVLDLLVIGVVRAASARTESTAAAIQNVQSRPLSADFSHFPNDIEAERMPETRELEYEIVLLENEYPETGRNDLDELRGFDGVVHNCTVTYYCCEKREHVCGGGTGKTATGTDVTAGRSAAVDPNVIPLGAEILVDYGDGVLHSYVAEDTGSAVGGAHVDLAVATHDEALALGTTTATVWWSR